MNFENIFIVSKLGQEKTCICKS